jgi:hypothetical protein
MSLLPCHGRRRIDFQIRLHLDPFMIHEAFPTVTETAFGSHPCRVVSVTYRKRRPFHGNVLAAALMFAHDFICCRVCFSRPVRHRQRPTFHKIDPLRSVECRGVNYLESMNLRSALSSLWVGRRPMGTHNPKLGASNSTPATAQIDRRQKQGDKQNPIGGI